MLAAEHPLHVQLWLCQYARPWQPATHSRRLPEAAPVKRSRDAASHDSDRLCFKQPLSGATMKFDLKATCGFNFVVRLNVKSRRWVYPKLEIQIFEVNVRDKSRRFTSHLESLHNWEAANCQEICFAIIQVLKMKDRFICMCSCFGNKLLWITPKYQQCECDEQRLIKIWTRLNGPPVSWCFPKLAFKLFPRLKSKHQKGTFLKLRLLQHSFRALWIQWHVGVTAFRESFNALRQAETTALAQRKAWSWERKAFNNSIHRTEQRCFDQKGNQQYRWCVPFKGAELMCGNIKLAAGLWASNRVWHWSGLYTEIIILMLLAISMHDCFFIAPPVCCCRL